MSKKIKKVTMHDVASHAGVSYQTVSRVLNNSCSVSPATRAKIEKAIAELKYVPNMLAQQLSKNERRVIGLVNVAKNLQAPSDLVNGLRREAMQRGYGLLITLIDEPTAAALSESISSLKAQLIFKILINVPLSSSAAEQAAADHSDARLVFLDVDPYSPVLNVSFNPYDGTQASILHLKELGHRRVALIAGPQNETPAQLRLNSWLDILRQQGMSAAAQEYGTWAAGSGFEAMMNILRRTRDFTAVLVGNDQMALGAISALNQCGLRVPEDISVVGYDNTNDSAYFQPPLTTVSLDRDLQCRIAVEKIVDESGQQVSAVLPTSFVVRRSCAKAGSGEPDRAALAEELRGIAAKLERAS